jgi:putative ABC transport system permease protein
VSINELYVRALEELRRLPGVESVGLTNQLPLDSKFNLPFRLAGQSEWSGSAEYRIISPDYFGAMKMVVRRGRAFNEGDKSSAEPVIIVNEALARRSFRGSDPIGKQLCAGCEYGDPSQRQVVGVINDTKQRSLIDLAPPTVFIPLSQTPENMKELLRGSSFVIRTTGDPMGIAGTIRETFHRLDPALPVRNMRSLEQIVGHSVAPQRFNLSLLTLFAALGLMLAAIGIYGVLAYGVSQRTREIGLRMALGAQQQDVLKLVVKQGMVLALTGVVIGILASLALTRLMKSLLFGVTATDPLTFFVIALLLMAIALLACWIPARRASKVDPTIALRYE